MCSSLLNFFVMREIIIYIYISEILRYIRIWKKTNERNLLNSWKGKSKWEQIDTYFR